jgi:hypothetical protein
MFGKVLECVLNFFLCGFCFWKNFRGWFLLESLGHKTLVIYLLVEFGLGTRKIVDVFDHVFGDF